MGRRRKCRLWWPSNFSSQSKNPSSSCFLFGWFISASETSLDVVVAFGCDERKLSSSIDSYSDLQEILGGTNKNMHALLQDKCEFSLLGYYETDFCGNGPSVRLRNDKKNFTNFSRYGQYSDICSINYGSWSCGCSTSNGVLEQGRLVAPESMWMKLVYGHSRTTGRRVNAIPKLDHIHWNGESIFKLDLHVIIYDTPTFSGQHYSLGIQSFSNLGTSYKTPKWYDRLHQKNLLLDLDSIIRAINSANAAQMLFGGDFHPALGLQYEIVCKLTTFTWDLFAASVASLSTFIYIILQSSYTLSGLVSCPDILSNIFSKTCRNIHVRCCQLLYWPLFIQDHNIRHSSCLEFAEKAAFQKHSMWSNIVVDVLLGNIFGIALWYMAEPVCLLVLNFALDITNYWLRTGCVWLMGNPAGFKLNTELAGVLGMISLTAIQIWSTLWAYAGFLLIYFTKGLSLCGILFGLTTAAAVVIDVISLVTMHILSLHLFLSLLYSTQIQAVTALWRLFRGKKWNPLRHRLDSYDCSVEQQVVGSLLLTPIFLLLPTTSAFYIFFTILHTAVCIICIAIEVALSFIHATPYAKVLLWLKSKKRFPSGIWFEVGSYPHSEIEAASSSNNTSSEKLKQMDCTNGSEPTLLVSFLHSNYLNLGNVVWPHYRCIFSAFSWSSIASSAYGLLSGKSIPCSPGIEFPPKLPWIVIPWREYWHLCYAAVHSCKGDQYTNLRR